MITGLKFPADEAFSIAVIGRMLRYVSRAVNLTTLAPDIVEKILDETLPRDLTLFELAVDSSALWEEQRGWVERTSYIYSGYGRQLAQPRAID